LTNENVFNCFLNWQRLSDDRSEAGSLFQSRSTATSNDLSLRRVLNHGMTHVMVPDKRRWRLASGADLHASQRYDGVQPCSDLNISDASLKSTRHRTGSQWPSGGNNNKIIILGQCLWCCHHGRAIARVDPVHLMNVERRQAATDPIPSQMT